MRIAFIYPATEFDCLHHAVSLPMGLLYLTAMAEQLSGVEVDIFDVRYGPAAPSSEDLPRYDLIGFTAMSMQVITALKIANDLRAKGCRVPIVFGGPHASVATDHLKEQDCIDAILVGEGELTFLEYLKYLQGQPHKLERIWLRDADRTWRHFEGANYLENLDDLPLPARDKYGDVVRDTSFIDVTSTRGCPFDCTYCQPTKRAIFGNRVRRRTVPHITAEIRDAIDRFGIRSFAITDDTFTYNKRFVLDFCEQAKAFGLQWSCQSRSDVDRETLVAMRDSGCDLVNVGVESGSQRMLDLMNKHNKVETNEAFIQMCNEIGIRTWCNMMVGYPGETRADMDMSLDFVMRARPTISSHKDELLATGWDDVARHVRRAKFRSMEPLQPAIDHYMTLITRLEGGRFGLEMVGNSKLARFLGRRSVRIYKTLAKRMKWFDEQLAAALNAARAGRVDEGINQLKRLMTLGYKEKDLFGHLAWLYFSTGRPEEAEPLYRQLLEIDPGNEEVLRQIEACQAAKKSAVPA